MIIPLIKYIKSNTGLSNKDIYLFSISNKEYLLALNKLVDNIVYQTRPVQLSDEQITMLKLSDKEIEAGFLIPDDEVSKSDLQWLKEL